MIVNTHSRASVPQVEIDLAVRQLNKVGVRIRRDPGARGRFHLLIPVSAESPRVRQAIRLLGMGGLPAYTVRDG